jgi:hypothetical protein
MGATMSERRIQRRSKKLIAEFEDGYAKDWAMAVPACFRTALDIKPRAATRKRAAAGKGEQQITWMQGIRFAFTQGDTLYDTQAAYTKKWSEAMKTIKVVIQVMDGQPAEPSLNESADDETPLQPGEPGYLKAQIYRPSEDSSRIVPAEVLECSQEQFVELLRTGKMKLLDGLPYKLPA